MNTFRLPDLGEGLSEAEIISWYVNAGDHVVMDQPLLSVETDKALVDIPCPVSARVIRLHVAAGDIVTVDSPLLDLETSSAAQDTGTVVGVLPVADTQHDEPESKASKHRTDAIPHANAMPAVRRLATQLEVNLDKVSGSGPRGTITRKDVEQAALHASQDMPSTPPPGIIDPMRGARRAMAHNMSAAHAQVVPATLTDIIDIDAWSENDDVMLRMIQAISAACTREPALNASYLGLEQGRRLNEHINVGIAMDTEQGLFVPVLRNVKAQSSSTSRAELTRLKAGVRDRTLDKTALQGATISLSNFGMIDGLHATLVVLPPQVAIIGVGRIHERVVPASPGNEERIAIHRFLPVSITFDHRAVVGSETARFMSALREALSRPSQATLASPGEVC